MSKEEQMAVAQNLMETEADKVAPTPEDKAILAKKLQEDSGDGMSIGQKMASIAMAVAPTVVGYALHGTKGAYLGAAATGKGLEAGATEMDRQTRLDNETKRADAAMKKAEKDAAAKEKRASFDKLVTDEYGNQWFYDENNQLQPVKANGKQIRKPNTPISSYNAQTGQQETRMPYERAPGSSNVQEVPVNVRGAVNDLIGQSTKAGLQGFSVPPEVEAFIAKNPEGTMNDMTPTMRQRFMKVMDDQRALINKQMGDAANQARKPVKQQQQKGPAPTLQDKAAIAGYVDEVKNWNKGSWNAYKGSQSTAEIFFKKPLSEIKAKGVADSALWFNYMKEIQQDASVVREGDIATAMRFMSTKKKIDSWLSQYGTDLGSAMTEEMRKEIVNYLSEVRSIKERLAMADVNSMTTKGMRLGFDPKKVPVSSTAQDEARNWANPKIKVADTLGMAAGTPIWAKRVKDMVSQGQLKNGQFVKDTDGDPYLIEFYTGPSGKIGVRTRYWAVK
jgi:hypothetical protein